MLSLPSRCRRTARFWWAAISQQHRRTDAQSDRPTRCRHRLGRFVQPEREYRLCRQAIVVQADGKILAGGDFRHHRADRRAITSPGSMPPPAWPIRSTRTRINYVHSIVVQADGKILVGGLFVDIGGQTRHQIARLDATTGLADSFDPNVSPPVPRVPSIAVQADGKIMVGGAFTTFAPNGELVTRNNIARLEKTAGSIRRSISTSSAPSCFTPPLCSRTARFSSAAALRIRFGRDAQQHCATEHGRHARHGLQPVREWSGQCNRGAGGRKDSGGRTFSRTSAGRRATASPGSMPLPAGGFVRPERTRSEQCGRILSRCRRTARF